MLNIRSLCIGAPVNLRYVNRFSTSRCIRYENVAEHSFYVAYYALIIGVWVFENKRLLSDWNQNERGRWLGDVVSKAILHDLEESKTGDIHRPFKYSHPELKRVLDEAAENAINEVMDDMFFPLATQMEVAEELEKDSRVQKVLYSIWKNAKDDSAAGKVVQLADYLSVISYIMQEGPGAPARLNLVVMWDHAKKFNHEKFDFIRPLCDQALDLTKEVFGDG